MFKVLTAGIFTVEGLNEIDQVDFGLHRECSMTQGNEKPDTELTTEEAIHKLFPQDVIDFAKEVAHEMDLPEDVDDDSIPES